MSKHYLRQELEEVVKRDASILDFIESGSLDGIWYWDLDQPDQEWISPQFWRTFGYDPAEKEHLVSEWQDMIFQEDLKKIEANLKTHFEDPAVPFNQTVRYRHQDGSTVWVKCRGMAIRDDEGKPVRMLGAHVDITDLVLAKESLEELSHEYEKVFNGTQDALFLIEVLGEGQFRFIRNNRSHQKLTGIALDQLAGFTPQEMLGEELGDEVSQNYQRAVEANEPITYEETLTLMGKTIIWETTLTPYLENHPPYIVGSAVDITERKKLELKLEQMANYDELTKLANRHRMMQELEKAVQYQKTKEEAETFALFFLDLDGFKQVNDRYGHEMGDRLLMEVADRLRRLIQEPNLVARIGGDEFTGILWNAAGPDELTDVIDRIYDAVKEPIEIEGRTLQIDASIGVVLYPEDADDPDTLLNQADKEMYRMKRNKQVQQ
ncbi:sensor domain-containing diguanylate cyclase [Salisediminibacterium beveridgei]|uniref:Uncharacterized protein with PAS and GGDEF domains n=1 Tax=Salisediminibacterium beveridgei TaxID=632773 RepID=A0A1D7QS02_9BACI|nr:sensor domain-containing diguanylate cyclase [Salisediminibacterium beveridgei]AOM81794.1 uncharacterized protein with PAS and GGDEF domains [Salisediminibacterium beveridgei]